LADTRCCCCRYRYLAGDFARRGSDDIYGLEKTCLLTGHSLREARMRYFLPERQVLSA